MYHWSFPQIPHLVSPLSHKGWGLGQRRRVVEGAAGRVGGRPYPSTAAPSHRRGSGRPAGAHMVGAGTSIGGVGLWPLLSPVNGRKEKAAGLKQRGAALTVLHPNPNRRHHGVHSLITEPPHAATGHPCCHDGHPLQAGRMRGAGVGTAHREAAASSPSEPPRRGHRCYCFRRLGAWGWAGGGLPRATEPIAGLSWAPGG